MTRSMTAYGRCELTGDGKDITVELKSVNSRYFDCSVKLPRLYGFLEERVKSYIQTHGISRGKVDVYIGIDIVDSIGAEITLDEGYVGSYIAALKKLRDGWGLKDDISVMSVAQKAEIFNIKKPEEDLEGDWLEVRRVLDGALDEFTKSRELEGENMRADIVSKRDRLKAMKDEIAGLSEESIASYRSRLEARLRAVLGELDYEFDNQRILTECAIFADKVAIDEELVRLDSHFKALDVIINADEPAGRKLDFLVQEMNREINTIGSKANESRIASLVVDMKAELEKMREQIQNIE